jgi:HK97 gp10 family phage protein
LADDGGIGRLQQRLAAIPSNVKAAVQPALVKQATIMANDMKRLAEPSRDTGALINSITVTPAGQETPPYSQPGGSMLVPENAAAITVGNSDVRYAHLVEYGTRRTHPKPFFWPAFRLDRKKAQAAIKRAIVTSVKKNWGSA